MQNKFMKEEFGRAVIDFPELFASLSNINREGEWDQATGTLFYLSPADRKHLPALINYITDANACFGIRNYALTAVVRVDLGLTQSAEAVASVLEDKNDFLQGEAAKSLAYVSTEQVPVVVPALVRAAKNWRRSTVGAQIDAFGSLSKLLGFAGALKAMWQ